MTDAGEPVSGEAPPFAEATAIAGGGGRYRAELSAAYRTATGPFGGYLATIALRAAAAETDKPRPTSFSCHFLAIADPGPLDITVSCVHQTRRAASLTVDIGQGDARIATAMAWFTQPAGGVDCAAPRVPHAIPPELVRPFEEVHRNFRGFWFAEARPIYEPVLSQPSPPREPPWSLNDLEYLVDPDEPTLRAWGRLRPVDRFDDPALEAGRSLVLADWFIPFLAAGRHAGRRVVLHSSLDLRASFHSPPPHSPWLYCEASVGVAREGIAAGDARVWSRDGELVATVSQQMVQRVRL